MQTHGQLDQVLQQHRAFQSSVVFDESIIFGGSCQSRSSRSRFGEASFPQRRGSLLYGASRGHEEIQP